MSKSTLAALAAVTFQCAASAGVPVTGGPLDARRLMSEIQQTLLMAQAVESKQPHARLTDSQVLMTHGNPVKAELTECQPLKGETVAIAETRTGIDGVRGLDAALVVVLEGRCQGTSGWVGLPRLERLAAPSGPAVK